MGSGFIPVTAGIGKSGPGPRRYPRRTAAVTLAIATGAGALIFSHVNDGGFWIVKEYFNMSVGQTMKTWSVAETIIAVCGLIFTSVLWHFA